MLKRGSSEYQKLLKQGYSEDMILLALNESESKSFDNVVDLLHFREKHYKETLASRKLRGLNHKSAIIDKQNLKDASKQNENEDKNGKYVFEDPIEVTQLIFGQQPQKAALRLDKKGQDICIAHSNLPVLEQGHEKKPAEAPKGKYKEKFDEEEKIKAAKKKRQGEKITNQGMEEDLVVFIETMNANLIKEGTGDPNESLIKLASYFKQISTEETPTIISLRKHFSLWSEPPLIKELQNAIFSLLNRILTTKTNENVDQNRLEYCLERAFGMRLLSGNQMRSLQATCKKFYKTKHLDYTDICERLDKCREDYGWGEPPRWYVEPKDEEYEEEKVNEEQKEKLIAKARAKEKRRKMQEQREKADEERKCQLVLKLNQKKYETNDEEFEADESSSENEVEIEKVGEFEADESSSENEVEVEKVEQVEQAKAKGMEECLICMGNIREIVFLPCSHFLTCSACSTKVNKCPLCSKAIEKNQKIYWS